MQFFQILDCSSSPAHCCNDPGLAIILAIIKRVMNIIQIVVPILLMIFVTIQFIQMMTSPDDKKSTKKLINKFVAAVIVFLLPVIVNLVIGLLPEGERFELSNCWKAADEVEFGRKE